MIKSRQGEVKEELLELFDVSGVFDDKLIAGLNTTVTAANNTAAVSSTRAYTAVSSNSDTGSGTQQKNTKQIRL